MMEDALAGIKMAPDLVAGYDLVNEEDTTPQLLEFAKLILEGRKRGGDQGFSEGLPLYLHAGESVYRQNVNMYDAVLLGSKRIGHGNMLNQNPELLDLIKERKVLIEICPISSFLLGYCSDLRVHPSRYLLNRGVPVSLNSDDPGFWGYDGVTLDFAYATVAWQLDLKDLKQFALNAINYSSFSKEIRQEHLDIFQEEWTNFVKQSLGSL